MRERELIIEERVAKISSLPWMIYIHFKQFHVSNMTSIGYVLILKSL